MKKTTTIFRILTALSFISILFFTACKNNNHDNADNNDTIVVPAINEMKVDTMSSPKPATKKGKGMVNEPVAPVSGKVVKDEKGIYNHAEVDPKYPGGQSALDDYIKDNIQYPVVALDNDIEGKVMVRFVIDEEGNVTDVTTLNQPVGYGIEKEAVRVVSGMPQWTPGTVKCKKVKTYMQLPIVFTL